MYSCIRATWCDDGALQELLETLQGPFNDLNCIRVCTKRSAGLVSKLCLQSHGNIRGSRTRSAFHVTLDNRYRASQEERSDCQMSRDEIISGCSCANEILKSDVGSTGHVEGWESGCNDVRRGQNEQNEPRTQYHTNHTKLIKLK